MSGDKARLAWFKSSYSAGDGGQCVEVAAGNDTLYVRDSKDKVGPVVGLAPGVWADFVGFAARHTV
ncbi:DUF397 domain-containing protein [Streptomyces pimonensis]|uniref:DUF397 domain-containing protein n=1 Tax=Streptomyces pimonensis TaxID=2860288 RepID=A0ABV4IVI5_9ACTN